MDKTIYSKEHEKIVERLIRARIEAGLTQKQVAKKLNVTQSYISKIEGGQVGLDIVFLKKLTKVLRVSISNLVD